jgi:hypothetical protein
MKRRYFHMEQNVRALRRPEPTFDPRVEQATLLNAVSQAIESRCGPTAIEPMLASIKL